MVDDAGVARLARRQERVVTSEQLARAGMSWNAIAHRLEQERMVRLWRGVYLLGPDPPGPRSLAMAGVLSCRGEAVVSYVWAGHLWGYLPFPGLPVDITIGTGSHRGRREVRVHRTRLTDPRDFTFVGRVPVTSPARTLLDLAEVLEGASLEGALAEAQVLKRVTERGLEDVLNRAGRRQGARKMRRLLTESTGLTRSEAERILRRLLRDAALPRPRSNVKLGSYEVDFYWPRHGLIVEIDGFAAHGHRRAFERDRRKRAELTAMGHRVVAFTWRQLTEEPYFVVAALAAALAQSSSRTADDPARRTSASMPFAGSGREK